MKDILQLDNRINAWENIWWLFKFNAILTFFVLNPNFSNLEIGKTLLNDMKMSTERSAN